MSYVSIISNVSFQNNVYIKWQIKKIPYSYPMFQVFMSYMYLIQSDGWL